MHITPRLKAILWSAIIITVFAISTGVSIYFANQESTTLGANLNGFWAEKDAEKELNMLFVGDVMLGRYIKVLMGKDEANFPFTYMPDIISKGEETLDIKKFDLIIGNLECPMTDSTYVNSGTTMIFNCDPDAASLLSEAGFTTMTMANNHMQDMGVDGINQTHMNLENSNIDGFGHPDTVDGEYSFITYQFETMSLGFLGLNHTTVNKIDQAAAIAKIQELNDQVDFLIVSIHWGVEYEPAARDSIIELSHSFVDAGADFIHGHHPHVIQNWEIYNGAPIYYSLGNFIFDQYWTSSVREGLVVGLQINGDEVITNEFYVDLINQGEPKPR